MLATSLIETACALHAPQSVRTRRKRNRGCRLCAESGVSSWHHPGGVRIAPRDDASENIRHQHEKNEA